MSYDRLFPIDTVADNEAVGEERNSAGDKTAEVQHKKSVTEDSSIIGQTISRPDQPPARRRTASHSFIIGADKKL
ncbi:Hypothetical predicted protein [Cloeon dipterum]|uniref:Uncharacterized protein n=1 Tax=Cloeon dipterum TaxID=197152 RepID=A0A8S1CPU3_9INSE|nr:Hypothetical predicted protein [Cloeon dipterum]